MKSTIMWKLFPTYYKDFLPYALPSVIRMRVLKKEKENFQCVTVVEQCAISACFREDLKESRYIIHVMDSSTSCLFHTADQAISVQKIMVTKLGELVKLNTSQGL